ncbi:hypothetical protein AWJ20_85 [Sugiyamaella lignohabitans]|uniref:Cyclin-like domain-containing protein n=1 Tax=Sugiyamaella lignohabitans TaxID=796027 RepID=A0A161HGF5_9ASCO|nr:uncharacterized protein AWJ20_85 [Sugiyamaella lignohabitans]ANB11861.1 hypothetical protein AWJ20_85 [Sugiyamaella lignohabitans]
MSADSTLYTNALATSDQLNSTKAVGHGTGKDSAFHNRFLTANFIQTAGIYLRLSQTVISRAIVLAQRFYTTTGLRDFPIHDVAAAVLLISSKLVSGHPIKPEQLCYVVQFLSLNGNLVFEHDVQTFSVPQTFDVIDTWKQISPTEMEVLAGLAFDTNVVLPYSLALSYIQVLSLHERAGSDIIKLTWSTINDGIRDSPFLTIVHQPNTIAVTSIILAATKLNVVVSDQVNWWDMFDVNSEDVGHSMALILEGKEYASYIRNQNSHTIDTNTKQNKIIK